MQSRKVKSSRARIPKQPSRTIFPIVGIGASAGGLEAFIELLSHLPPTTGMGFVLVQHLDPSHKSSLVEILQRNTSLPITEVENNHRVEPNHIYVIPPNAAISIQDGVLKVVTGRREQGAQHSVDAFFQSLAEDRGPAAIGVVLSGSASDGARGIEEIKSAGGITIAQDELTAKFSSMPRNAIATGCVDFVLPPKRIAEELATLATFPGLMTDSTQESEEGTSGKSEFAKVLQLLRARLGIDLTLYKLPTLHRRVKRRMVLRQTPSVDAYVKYLRRHSEELDALYQDLLINVTRFFRDPEMFEALKQEIFPRLLKNRAVDDPIRVWVVGCSTGQEAYSIAIAYLEFAANNSTQVPIRIFATDLNETVLEKARTGLYTKSQVQDLAPQRVRRFFTEEDGGMRICKPVRELCVFARHDVLSDSPFSRMDLVSCRNVMIYLEPVLQKKLIPVFHYALKPNAFLLLGNSETLSGSTDLFAPEGKKIFSKKGGVTPRRAKLDHPPSPDQKPSARKTRGLSAGIASELDIQKEADRIALAKYAPAGVLVSDAMQILQFRGQTSPFLEPTPGRANFNLLKMLREGLLLPVRAAIERARKRNEAVRTEQVEFRYDGHTRLVTVEVTPVKSAKESCFLVVFEPVAGSAKRGNGSPKESNVVPPATHDVLRENARLRRELEAAKDYLQTVTEQHDAVQEELQASSEEAESSNEELQSINEELETTKEELESTNEELTTVNEEMNNRNTELHRIVGDLNNVLASAQLCVVVLSSDLTIRRFTPLAEKILNIVPTDIGRPLTHLQPNLALEDLQNKILEVIHSVSPSVEEVQDRNGHWFSLRLFPYKTIDNRIDGAVMVLVDIDAVKRSEMLKESEHRFRTLAEALPQLVWSAVPSGECDYFNGRWTEYTGVPLEKLLGDQWRETMHIDDRQHTCDYWIEALKGTVPYDLEFRLRRKDGVFHWFKVRANPVMDSKGRPLKWFGTCTDIEDQKQSHRVIEQSEYWLRLIMESVRDFAIFTTDPQGRVIDWNPGAQKVFGYLPDEILGESSFILFTPEDREQSIPEKELLTAASEGCAMDERWHLRKDGERLFMSGATRAIRDENGLLRGFTKVARDITDRKRQQEDLQRAHDDLERRVSERTAKLGETVQDLEAFSYSISHDLRAPLRAMLGFAHMALSDPALGPIARASVERIVSSANRLDRLIVDVLAYSRVNQAEMALKPIELDQLVREVLQQYPGLQSPEITIRIEGPLLPVMAHEAALTQCVANYLHNAIKFVTPGSNPYVRVWTERVEDFVRLNVQDNGIGIVPDNLHRIFGIFERLNATSKYEGTGIGLAIVRKAAERMGGSVGVESEFGKGSIFWIKLRAATY